MRADAEQQERRAASEFTEQQHICPPRADPDGAHGCGINATPACAVAGIRISATILFGNRNMALTFAFEELLSSYPAFRTSIAPLLRSERSARTGIVKSGSESEPAQMDAARKSRANGKDRIRFGLSRAEIGSRRDNEWLNQSRLDRHFIRRIILRRRRRGTGRLRLPASTVNSARALRFAAGT